MGGLVSAFYNGYIKGGAVERPAEAFVENIYKHNPDSTALQKTSHKIALYWTGVSLTAATTAALTITVAAPCAVGFLGLGFFAKPLYSSIMDYFHELPAKLTTRQRVEMLATWLAGAGVQAAVIGVTVRETSTLVATTTNILASSLTVGGAIMVTSQVCKQREETLHLDPQAALVGECTELELTISETQAKILKLDAFIKERPDLLIMTQELMTQYADHIAHIPAPPPIAVHGPDDIIGRRGVLMQKRNQMIHELNERMHFIKSHGQLLECFTKHVKDETEKKSREDSSSSSSSSGGGQQILLPASK